MEWQPCEACKKQSKMGRHDPAHSGLRTVGRHRVVRGAMTGGFEEQDYVCTACNAHFTHSSDRNDYGWILHNFPYKKKR